jgi:uncharacterized protein (DUF58 family)
MELEQLLARARRVELKTRHLARSQYAGLYKSAFRGLGMEFGDVREYSSGDDIRLIDWNVSARSHSLYVKRMVEERERNILILLDTSGSLQFGSACRTKYDLLVELGALLAISGFYARDRVSLAAFAAGMELYVPAAKGWNHTARLIREMISRPPANCSPDMEPVWSFLTSPGVPRSVVVLLSDFQAPLRPCAGFSAACRKHELVVLLVSDPREWEMPRVGRVRLQDTESGRFRVVNTNSAAVREEYRQNGRRQRELVAGLFRTAGIDWLELSTNVPYESALRRFLERRSIRRGYRHP